MPHVPLLLKKFLNKLAQVPVERLQEEEMQDQVDHHLKAALDLVDHHREKADSLLKVDLIWRLKVKFPCLKVKDQDRTWHLKAKRQDQMHHHKAKRQDQMHHLKVKRQDQMRRPQVKRQDQMRRLKVKDQGQMRRLKVKDQGQMRRPQVKNQGQMHHLKEKAPRAKAQTTLLPPTMYPKVAHLKVE